MGRSCSIMLIPTRETARTAIYPTSVPEASTSPRNVDLAALVRKDSAEPTMSWTADMSAPSPCFANIQRLFQGVACLSAELTRNFENFIAILASRQLLILPFGLFP